MPRTSGSPPVPAHELEETFTRDQVAEFLHVSVDHLTRILHGRIQSRRPLPFFQPGHHPLILRSDLEAYCGLPEGRLKPRQRGGPPPPDAYAEITHG